MLTSFAPGDDAVEAVCREAQLRCVRGDEADVLDRFRLAIGEFPAALIVRITADCPLIDPEVVDDLLRLFRSREGTAAASVAAGQIGPWRSLRRYPSGLDAEALTAEALDTAWREATTAFDREHVTPYIWRDPDRFPALYLECERDLANEQWDVDHREDLEFIRAVYARLGRDSRPFGWRDVMALLERDPSMRGRRQLSHPSSS